MDTLYIPGVEELNSITQIVGNLLLNFKNLFIVFVFAQV